MPPFAVIDKKQGKMVYIGLHDDEADCWKVYLGWPAEAEIEDAKKRGLSAERVAVKRYANQPAE